MSVDITAFIGIGWIVTQEQKEAMVAAAGEWADEVEDAFRYINSYYADTDLFLGEIIASAEAGTYFDLEDLNGILVDLGFEEKYADLLEKCGEDLGPGTMWFEPKLYLINQLW